MIFLIFRQWFLCGMFTPVSLAVNDLLLLSCFSCFHFLFGWISVLNNGALAALVKISSLLPT